MSRQASVFESVNYALLRQLERLDAAQDYDEIAAEVERANATCGLAKEAIANVNALVGAVRCMDELGQPVRLPSGLLGEGAENARQAEGQR